MDIHERLDLQRIARRNPIAILFVAVFDFLNRLGRHWFMLLILLGGVCLAIRGTILLDFGVAYLFREDRTLTGFSPGILLQSPSFFTELLAVMLAGAAWVFAVDLDAQIGPDRPEPKFHQQLPGLALRIILLAALPFLALVYPASDAIAPLRDGEVQRAALGWLFGVLLSLAVLSVASLVESGLQYFTIGHFGIRGWLVRRAPRVASWVAWDNIIWRVIILWAMYVVAWAGIIVVAVHLPAVAIFALVGVALGGYVALNFVVERMRFYFILAIFGLAFFARGGDAYLYRFPGLEAQYSACDRLQGSGPARAATARKPIWCARNLDANGEGGAGAAGEFRQLPRSASLQALKTLRLAKGVGATAQLPKLVVVAISGGAYRAAFWGALVLDRLRAESAVGQPLEGLAEGIRLLSGSSGGMVPAAYYVTLPPAKLAGHPLGTGLEEMISRDIGAANGLAPGEASFDSLSPIAQQLVRKDIFNTFRPGRTITDRGRTLDRQWGRLNITFAALRAEEAAGRRPSLILSPMIAETGQPLLISNLDLTGISGPLRGEAKGAQQTIDLFRTLPEAARGLTLATAVRMSATFPLITPAVSLPTIPPLHPLDAGYFDDYGMGVALAYLKQHDVIDWIAANTSGVILVQINAFPVHAAPADAGGNGCTDLTRDTLDGYIIRSLSPIVSPLAGLFSSRGASMVFRNDQGFDTLQQLMHKVPGKDGKPLSFELVAFENAARASFSWYLPQRDLECMRGQLDAAHNKVAMARLVELWRDGSVEPVESGAIPAPAAVGAMPTPDETGVAVTVTP